MSPQVCIDVGARLCTVDEMVDGATAKANPNGGTCEGAWFWTGTVCGENGDGIMVAGQAGKGMFRPGWGSYVDHGTPLPRSCARKTENHSVACCSSWAATDKQAQLDDYRAVRGIHLGNFSYCRGHEMPCRAGEGHCRKDSDCHFNTHCAIGAGGKYALPEGTGVCIPKYGSHQITFWPTLLYKGQPTDMLLVERGKEVLPQQALVRIVQGSNPGCLGVWDSSVPIVAQTLLNRTNGHLIRPEGFPVEMAGHCGPGDEDLPYSTQPYMKWEGLLLEGSKAVADALYKDPRYEVCLCDASADCASPTNWHDLGFLNLEPAASWFASTRGNGWDAQIGVGGDLYESYREKDIAEYWPDMVRLRSSASEPVHHELCAQRCMANPLCLGFDLTDPNWNGGRSKTCTLRGEGMQLQILSREYVGDASPNVYLKMESHRQSWCCFPCCPPPHHAQYSTTHCTLPPLF